MLRLCRDLCGKTIPKKTIPNSILDVKNLFINLGTLPCESEILLMSQITKTYVRFSCPEGNHRTWPLIQRCIYCCSSEHSYEGGWKGVIKWDIVVQDKHSRRLSCLIRNFAGILIPQCQQKCTLLYVCTSL